MLTPSRHKILVAITDIGYLQGLLNKKGYLSEIAVFVNHENDLNVLRGKIPTHLKLEKNHAVIENQTGLASTINLNLKAMSVLAFIVSCFLVYNAIYLNYQHRQILYAQAFLCGVSQKKIAFFVVIELLFLSLIASVVGTFLGWNLAEKLLPLINQMMNDFGNGEAINKLEFHWNWLLIAYFSAFIALFISGVTWVFRWQGLTPKDRLNLSKEPHKKSFPENLLFILGGVSLLISYSLSIYLLSHNAHLLPLSPLYGGFMVMALYFIGIISWMPLIINILLKYIKLFLDVCRPYLSLSSYAITQWVVADSQQILKPSIVAFIAMVLALVSNMGMNMMVESFREATKQWIEQRIVGDFYVTGVGEVKKVLGSLESRTLNISEYGIEPQSLLKVYPTQSLHHRSLEHKINIRTTSNQELSKKRLQATLYSVLPLPWEALWQDFITHKGVFISEQAAFQHGWSQGKEIELTILKDKKFTPRTFKVLGIYHDYGNPVGELVINEKLFTLWYPEIQPHSLSLSFINSKNNTNILENEELKRFASDFLLNAQGIRASEVMKRNAMSVFDRTFQITRILNLLTFIIAVIGISCSCFVLVYQRQYQMNLLSSLGLTRWHCCFLSVARWCLLTGLSVVLCWPFAYMMTRILVDLINPLAFGWRYEVIISWENGLWLFIVTLFFTFVISFVPSWRCAHVVGGSRSSSHE